MPQLPSRESLGGLPSGRSGRPVATVDFSAGADAQIQAGRALSQLGAQLQAVQKQKDSFEAEKQFQQFRFDQERQLEESTRNIQPGGADGFANSFQSNYQKQAQDFLGKLPESARQEYELKTTQLDRGLWNSANGFERAEQKRYSIQSIDELKNNTYAARIKQTGDFKGVHEDFTELVRRNPFLTDIEKADVMAKGLRDLEQEHVLSRLEKGEDPTAILGDLRRSPFKATQLGPGKPLAPDVEDALGRAAQQAGVDPNLLRTFVHIESGGKPGAQTGSYKGLLQLSDSEFQKHGGQGDIFDMDQNLAAGAAKIKQESEAFAMRYGREPTATELYMMHQQGTAGAAAHMANPDRPAWQNMLSTGEGRQKGEAWAKKAIWGNVPDDVKKQFGSVENMTSRDFMGVWEKKVARFAGSPDKGQAIPVEAATGEGQLSEGLTYRYLTSEQRRQLEAKANRTLDGNRFDLKRQMDDDIESIRKTGVSRLPDIEKAKKVLEPNQINTYVGRREQAIYEYQVTHDLPALTDQQLNERLTIANPKPGSKDYAFKSKIFDTVQQNVKKIRELRRNDPAAAVDHDEYVQKAMSQLKEDDPESYGFLTAARWHAQDKLGIPEPSRKVLTRDEAKNLMAPLKNVPPEDLAESVKSVINLTQKRYGRFAKEAFFDAVSATMRSKVDAQVARDTFTEIAENGRVSLNTQQKVKENSDINLREVLPWGYGWLADFAQPEGPPKQEETPVAPPEPSMETKVGEEMGRQFKMEGLEDYPAPSSGHIEALKANPNKAADFDTKFGPGAAAKILGRK